MQSSFLQQQQNSALKQHQGQQRQSNEQIITLKNHSDPLEKNDIVTITSGGDNIITISSANLNDSAINGACDQLDEIKTLNHQQITSETTTDRVVHFLTNQTTNKINSISIPTDVQSTTNSVGNSNANQVETTKNRCCNLTNYVSSQENIADVHHRKGRRLHGLQLPLHPLQIFGWLVLVIFGLTAYFVLIPSFTSDIQGPLYGLITGLYIVHIVSHLTALLTDPADRELRRVHRNDRIVPEFDRAKHSHVIENGRCHLCNIRTSSQRTKHCSVCNKCVGKFDHHCKWLNHCIGSRNYVAFLMCVVSAVIATLVIVAAVIAQITFYYVKPEWLSFWFANETLNVTVIDSNGEFAQEEGTIAFVINTNFNGTFITSTNETLDSESSFFNSTNASVLQFDEDTLMDNSTVFPTILDNITLQLVNGFNETISLNLTNDSVPTTSSNVVKANNTIATIAGIGISNTVFLILIGFLGLLAAITAGLLLHLCFFHIYISFLGLTTYEYIRNHRQAQEAKAKSLLSSLPNQQPTTTTGSLKSPSKKTNAYSQIYFCSSLHHPNLPNPNELRYFESDKAAQDEKSSCTKLHCCASSREYNHAAVKTYFMCSLLEEQPSSLTSPMGVSHISGGNYLTGSPRQCEENDEELQTFKTFHCCSSFAATSTQRRVSAASTKATLVTDTSASRRAFTQYSEQCTFCTFRIRSPLAKKRKGNSGAASTRTCSGQQRGDSQSTSHSTKSSSPSVHSTGIAVDHERCCMKAISKHQRWRKKWNCCSSIPDSPDVPNDIIAALTLQQQQSATSAKNINATEIPVQFIKTANENDNCGADANVTSPPHSAKSNSKRTTIRNNARTWPVARLRHMLRMLNRQRRPQPSCRHHNSSDDKIKQNQIRPLQLQTSNELNGSCHHHHHHHHHHHQHQQSYYDSSSPQPPSSTTTERSSGLSLFSDSSALPTPISTQPCSTIETILPTSIIRDDTSVTYTMPALGITLPPALPPPTRRKMPNPTDLEELAESLGFSFPHECGTLSPTSQQNQTSNTAYRRQRRKHFLRTRSPTLSPIHESGLSNPTSPQPCRHNAQYTTTVVGSTLTTNNNCGSNETVRKTSSNSSLHSVSSNSSSA